MSRDSPWIAVVDDEESVCKALRRLLQSAGLEVATFAGGGEFLDSLGVRQPACVVLDLNMPDVILSCVQVETFDPGPIGD